MPYFLTSQLFPMKKSQARLVLIPLFLILISSLWRCDQALDSSDGSGTGIGGSLNRFTIIDSFLFVLNNDQVESYSIDAGKMEFISATRVDEGIETIFPFDSILLIGGQRGMYLCELRETGEIVVLSAYQHVVSCDPVVTDGHFAYVTLSAGCQDQANQLDILDVTDIQNPVLLASYPMTHPRGLGVDGILLFICDTTDGLKIYDRTDPKNIELLFHFTGFEPYDVIPYKGLLFVLTDSDIRQFDYKDPGKVFEISSYQLK